MSIYNFSATLGQQRKDDCPMCPVFLSGAPSSDGNNFTALIIGSIQDIEYYLPLLECLSAMGENDTINIWIDSPGGYINSGATIATHIVNCAGKVTTIAMGMCASAGSLIWSAGHECKFTPMATFMWHMSSHMDYGNSLAIRNESNIQVEYVRNILLEVSLRKGHITKEEVERICNDEHAKCAVWISAKEMAQRMNSDVPEEDIEVQDIDHKKYWRSLNDVEDFQEEIIDRLDPNEVYVEPTEATESMNKAQRKSLMKLTISSISKLLEQNKYNSLADVFEVNHNSKELDDFYNEKEKNVAIIFYDDHSDSTYQLVEELCSEVSTVLEKYKYNVVADDGMIILGPITNIFGR